VNAPCPIAPGEYDAARELERLEGARHIDRMRRIDELLPFMSNKERTAQARAFHSLIAQLQHALGKCERFVLDNDTPAYLCCGSTVPLRSAR
jgi:hypothetical protein